jgi:hypothetical protein
VESYGLFRSKNLDMRAVNALLPFPAKYKQVWVQSQGKESLYAWRAVPPSDDFVALGNILTPL